MRGWVKGVAIRSAGRGTMQAAPNPAGGVCAARPMPGSIALPAGISGGFSFPLAADRRFLPYWRSLVAVPDTGGTSPLTDSHTGIFPDDRTPGVARPPIADPRTARRPIAAAAALTRPGSARGRLDQFGEHSAQVRGVQERD